MHPTDDGLRLLLDEEMLGDRAHSTARHLEACTECQARLDQMGEDGAAWAAAFERLDLPAPAITADALMRRADLEGSRSPRWAAAAAVASVFLAGSLLALPSSPFRIFPGLPSRGEPASDELDRPPVVAEGVQRGVALRPEFEAQVVFPEHAAGEVAVRLVAGDELRLEAFGADVGFGVRGSRIHVDQVDIPVRYVLTVPQQLEELVVRAGSRILFRKSGSMMIPAYDLSTQNEVVIPLLGDQGENR